MADTKEIYALISLLDDPDENIYVNIRGRLESLGQEVIPVLEDAWENSFDPLIQGRIEAIIHNIQFDNVKRELKHWAQPENRQLLEGAIIIARYQYPDLDELKIIKHLEQIKQDIWLELNQQLTALEKVKILNHIIFDVHNFSGNTTNYHAPQNSYINNVMESKKGNPLSLSIVYSIIAQSLGLPIYGVNLPEHFILCYANDNSMLPAMINSKAPGVLFYINTFSKGSVFGQKEVDSFLAQLKFEQKPEYYNPCTNLDMIKRLLHNLVNSYEKLGYPAKADEIRQLFDCLPED